MRVPVHRTTLLTSMRVGFFLLAAVSLNGGTINVTGSKFAFIKTGATITADFGIGNYGPNNPGVSPYPISVSVAVIGQIPQGLTEEALPGTSQPYWPGMFLQGHLESVDGSISIPFLDPNATSLGLAPGYMIGLPGWIGGGGKITPVAHLRGGQIVHEHAGEGG